MTASRILVVYYSRGGTTRKVAETVAAVLGADIAEITEPRSRAGVAGYLRSVVEARRERPAAVQPLARDPAAYDLVLVGGPVWAWSVASPVRAFLAANRARLGDVGFFCTLGGAGAERCFGQMQAILGRAPHATCAITGADFAARREGARIAAFVAALRLPPTEQLRKSA